MQHYKSNSHKFICNTCLEYSLRLLCTGNTILHVFIIPVESEQIQLRYLHICIN